MQEIDPDTSNGIRTQDILAGGQACRNGVARRGARAGNIATPSEARPLEETRHQATQTAGATLGHAAEEFLGDLLRGDAVDGREYRARKIAKRIGG